MSVREAFKWCVWSVWREAPYIAWIGRFPPKLYMETQRTAFRRISTAFPPKCTWTGFKGVRPNPWFGRTPSSAGPTLLPLATVLLWYTAWWALVLVCRCRGFVGWFGLSSGFFCMCYAGRDLLRLCLRILHIFFLFQTCAPENINLRKLLWS